MCSCYKVFASDFIKEVIVIAVQFKKTGVVNASGEGVNPNLVLNSSEYVENNSYNTKNYSLSSDLVANTAYTVTIEGSLGSGKSYFGLWLGGGNSKQCELQDLGNGVYRSTWTFNGTVGGNGRKDMINIYAVPSSVSGVNSSIKRVKVEVGSVPTPWIPNEADDIYVGSTVGFSEVSGTPSIGKAGYVQTTNFIEY